MKPNKILLLLILCFILGFDCLRLEEKGPENEAILILFLFQIFFIADVHSY